MDMNLVYALLITAIPVVLTVIFSKRYNVFHGVISFVVFSYLLIFFLSVFAEKVPADIYKYLIGADGNPCLLTFYIALVNAAIFGLNQLGLEAVLSNADYGQYVLLAVYVVVFVVSQIIASLIRKHRVNTIKNLKREIKRY